MTRLRCPGWVGVRACHACARKQTLSILFTLFWQISTQLCAWRALAFATYLPLPLPTASCRSHPATAHFSVYYWSYLRSCAFNAAYRLRSAALSSSQAQQQPDPQNRTVRVKWLALTTIAIPKDLFRVREFSSELRQRTRQDASSCCILASRAACRSAQPVVAMK